MIQSPERWARIEALFHQALDQPEREREGWLREHCADDETVRREVASLLAADAPGSGTIAAAVAEAAAPLRARVGGRVGPYRLIDELGHGGMGSVYLAEREGIDFQQKVALKLLHGVGGAERAARFRSERRILAGLEHPNIARLLDGGATNDGAPYLVMEYVPGVPIDTYCLANDLSVEDRLRLFAQVCDAVDHAHSSLVVHRDIKPSNILVTADGTPKLLDFGIAKLLDPDTTTGEQAPVTGTFVRLFTRDYASPEQIRGEAITTATDTYALGVLLYELLSGTRPFHFVSQRLEDIERVVTSTEPAKPSTVVRQDDTRLSRQLAGDLDTIVLTAMDKEPKRRYASAGRLAEDVRRHLEKRPILARPTTWSYRTGRFIMRHRLAVAAASVVVAVVLGGGVLYALQAQRVQRERDTAEQVVSFRMERFSVADPSESRGNSITAREILDRGAARIEADLAGQPDVQARMLDAMGGVYRSLGLYERSQSLLERALGVREALDGRRTLEAAATMSRLAETLRDRSKPTDAEPLVRDALEIRRALAGPRDPLVARSLNALGTVQQALGRQDQALQSYEEALGILRERGQIQSAEAGSVYHNIANVYRDRQDYDKGVPAAREALRIRRAVLGADAPQVAASVTTLGQLLDNHGKDAEAEVLLREARDRREKIFGPDHPMATQAANNLASVIHDQGRYAEAEPLYRQALEKNRARLGDHFDTAMNLNNLATLLEDAGRYDEAGRYYRESLDMRRRVFGPNHVNVARTLNNYARFLMIIGRPAEALPLMEETERIRLLTLKPDHVDIVTSRLNRVAILSQLGRRAEADREFPVLIEQLRQKVAPGSVVIGGPLGSYARHLLRTGRPAEALPVAEEGLAVRVKSLPPTHWQVAQLDATAGEILVQLGRPAEGVPRLERSLAALRAALPAGDWRIREVEGWVAGLSKNSR